MGELLKKKVAAKASDTQSTVTEKVAWPTLHPNCQKRDWLYLSAVVRKMIQSFSFI